MKHKIPVGPKQCGKRRHHSAHNVVCKRNLVDIFYHIRQVAARFTKLVLECTFGTPF